MSDTAPRRELSRELNAFHVQLISLGGIIGSAYFLGVGKTIAEVGPATALSFMLGGGIVWLVANGMGELCVAMPRAGTFISYAKELVGRPWAAGVGWSYWINWCVYVPGEMVAAGIVMNAFFPSVPIMIWAVAFGLLITVMNLVHVGSFGNVESALALIKIAAVVAFSVAGVLIWLGWLGDGGFKGLSVLTSGRGVDGLFPSGMLATLVTMVMVLVSYQGTEIVAIAAAETQNPEQNIPLAIKSVSYRIIAIYVIPIIILVAIQPYGEASAAESPFADALGSYGMQWAGGVFSFVVLTAAFSCANSGLYSTVRALYSLSHEGLAPRWLTALNRAGVPARATYVSIAVCWLMLPTFVFFEGTSFFTWLLAVSGFAGAICWISISWCQLIFRRRLMAHGYTAKDLAFAAPGYPWLSYFAIVIQIVCLAVVALHPELRACLIIGVPALVVPVAVVWWLERRGRLRSIEPRGTEKAFEVLFPDRGRAA